MLTVVLKYAELPALIVVEIRPESEENPALHPLAVLAFGQHD
jgi:hypothetical protein